MTKTNQSTIAAGLGISRQAVSKLKAQGMPVSSLREAQKWRSENLSTRSMARATRAGDRGPLMDALRRRMISEAGLAEMKFRRERDALISTEAVQREFRAVYQRLVVAADELVQRVAPRITALTDAGEIHTLLDVEIRAFLEREASR